MKNLTCCLSPPCYYHLYWQIVQKQFGEDVELLPPRKFRFADRGQQARIEIQFQRNIPDSGWILALESNNKVNILVCVKVCMCSDIVNFLSLLCTRLESE